MSGNQYTAATMTDADYLAHWKSRCVINPVTGCWEWQGFCHAFMGAVHQRGYAGGSYRGKNGHLSRFIAGWKIGRPLVKGEMGLHSCDVPYCINPDHIYVGTALDNNREARDKLRDYHSGKTQCPHGHEYAVHGRINYSKGYKGWRACRLCQHLRTQTEEYKAAARERARVKRVNKKLAMVA